MKQVKGIYSGTCIYWCIVVSNKQTGEIIARDRSYAAVKRGYCKHIAALRYKLLESKAFIALASSSNGWGIPSLKAQQAKTEKKC